MLSDFAWKKAFSFSDREATIVLIISILSGFVLSFRMWGTDSFDASVGLSNLFLFSFIFLCLFFVFLASQKFVAALLGLDAQVDVWKYGPPIGVLVTLMSYGLIPFVFMGGVSLKEIPRLRLGKFRKTVINVKEMLYVGLAGPLVLLLFSLLIFFPLYILTGSGVFFSFVWVTSVILIVSAIPLPSLNGLNLLLKYRIIWVVYFLFSLFLYLLLSFLEYLFIYLLALFIAIILTWLLRRAIHNVI